MMMTIDELKASFPLVFELLDAACDEADGDMSWDRALRELDSYDLPRLSAAVERARAREFADCTAYDLIVEGYDETDVMFLSLVLIDPELDYLNSLLVKVFG